MNSDKVCEFNRFYLLWLYHACMSLLAGMSGMCNFVVVPCLYRMSLLAGLSDTSI